MTAPPMPPNVVYATFAGGIDQASVGRILQNFAIGQANGVTEIHLLFQSFGGTVGDGVCLYNIFRALPFDLTLYNAGAVQSIATIAFLGAKKRKSSTYATFMVHRTVISPQLATATRLEALTKSVRLDDTITETILRNHLNMGQEQWVELGYHDVVFSAEEAVKIGITNEIGEFSPPFGARIFNLNSP